MSKTSAPEGANLLNNWTNYFARFGTWVISILGGLGVALQNVMGIVALLQGVGMAATEVGTAFMHIIATSLGGLCSGVVNTFINLDTLESFFQRILGIKPMPSLERPQKIVYWLGVGVFIITGLLYGLTAFAFGPIGALAVLGIIAGVLVAGISTIQEMEVWLARFDADFKDVTEDGSTKSKIIGKIITIGTIISLSLLFTMGIATFMTGVGAPIIPSLIVGFGLSFTAGAFTEYVFYNRALGDFCQHFDQKWENFKKSRWPVLGFTISVLNGLVNGALAYIGMTLLIGLIVSTGVAAPPLGVVIAVGLIVAIFSGAASTMLGISFWPSNIEKVVKLFSRSEAKPDAPAPGSEPDSTVALLQKDALAADKPLSDKPDVTPVVLQPEIKTASPGTGSSEATLFHHVKTPLLNDEIYSKSEQLPRAIAAG